MSYDSYRPPLSAPMSHQRNPYKTSPQSSPQQHLSLSILPVITGDEANPNTGLESEVASTPRHARVLQNAVEQVLLGLIDVLTFCLRKTYSDRFNDFQRCAEANDMFDVHEWRRAQQDEWDRLSTLVCLHLPFCPLFCTSNRQRPLLIRLRRPRLSRTACPPGDYECSHLHESRPKLFIFPILLTMAWRSRVERVRMFSYPILLYQDIPYNR